MKLEFSRQLSERKEKKRKKAETLNFLKIRRVGTQLFHADRRADVTKLIVAFCNFAIALKMPETGDFVELFLVY
jgi:hypothetical protein